jgi:hypothetical protein
MVKFRNKLKLHEILNGLSTNGLLVLFPGYFLYHFGVSQAYFAPIFGGLYGVVSFSIFLTFSILMPSIWRFFKGKFYFESIVFSISLIYFFCWTFIIDKFFSNHLNGVHAFNESYSTLVIWIALFFVGRFTNFKIQNSLFIYLSVFGCIILTYVISIIKYDSFFAFFQIFQNGEDEIAISSYQQAGRSIFVFAIICSSFFINDKRTVGLFILLISLLILLSTGSRTDLVSLGIIVIFFTFYSIFKENNFFKKGLSVIFLSLALGYFIYLVKDFFSDSRASELLELSSSTSWNSRSDLSVEAIKIIKANPIFGKFDYYNDQGGYAHNILSSWTSFGIIGFALYSFLLFFFFFKSLFGFYRCKLHSRQFWYIAVVLNLICLIQAFFAAPIFSALPALGWGFVVNAIYNEHKFLED